MSNPKYRVVTDANTIPANVTQSGTLSNDAVDRSVVYDAANNVDYLTQFPNAKFSRAMWVYIPSTEELSRIVGVNTINSLQLETPLSALTNEPWALVDASDLVFYSLNNNPDGAVGKYKGLDFPPGNSLNESTEQLGTPCDAATINAEGTTFYIQESYGGQ